MNDLVIRNVHAVRDAMSGTLAPVTTKARNWIDNSRVLAGRSEDKEFLPAHLEILETPPSPIRMATVYLLCAMLAAGILWSCFARLDIFAISPGRIQPSGRSKVVQPLDPGTVAAVRVANGSKVRVGDILLELDPTIASAEQRASFGEQQALLAETVRRQAAITAVATGQTDIPTITFPAGIDQSIRLREEAVLSAELGSFASLRATLQAQAGENAALRARLNGSIAARGRLIDVLRARLDMRQELVNRAAGTKAALLEMQQSLESELTNVAYDKGQLGQAEAASVSLARKLDQAQREFIADQSQKLTDAQRRLDRVREDVAKSTFKQERTVLRAPIDGTVQQLAVTTVGQVVTTGQPLLVLVPSEGTIEIEALVQNSDIGFIEVGQEATIKVNAFPFTRYGTIDGKVTRVSRDAVDAKDAGQSSDAATAARSQNQSWFSSTPNTQNLVFPVAVELDRTTLLVDGKEVPLTPGMTASVEIKTGDRRVIDYVFSPLREATSGAGHER